MLLLLVQNLVPLYSPIHKAIAIAVANPFVANSLPSTANTPALALDKVVSLV